jgi:hypothetical protein
MLYHTEKTVVLVAQDTNYSESRIDHARFLLLFNRVAPYVPPPPFVVPPLMLHRQNKLWMT